MSRICGQSGNHKNDVVRLQRGVKAMCAVSLAKMCILVLRKKVVIASFCVNPVSHVK